MAGPESRARDTKIDTAFSFQADVQGGDTPTEIYTPTLFPDADLGVSHPHQLEDTPQGTGMALGRPWGFSALNNRRRSGIAPRRR